jgi:hypothetical protein
MTSENQFCPQCGTKRVGYFRYCGNCRFDFESIAPTQASVATGLPEPMPSPRPKAVVVAPAAITPVAPTPVTPRASTRSIPRYAVAGAIGLLGIGAVSNFLGPSTPPDAASTSSPAFLAATATAVQTLTPSTRATPQETEAATEAPTPKPTAKPTQKPIVDSGRYRIGTGEREEFRGERGKYTFSRLAFEADRSTVRWTATAAAAAACRIVWRIDPSSGPTIKRTVRANAGDRVSGNERYSTTFSNAKLLVDSNCSQWNMSITGQEKPKPISNGGGGGNCDPSYPGVCIPRYPPDLDCGDISYRRFEVIGSDPHRFDADNDGIGCESG